MIAARAGGIAQRTWAPLRAGGALLARRGTILLVGLLCWLTLPFGSFIAGSGLDNSWAVGLGMALSRGLVFGRQVVFTFGPLGVIAIPRAVTPGTLLVGVIGAVAIEALLAWLLLSVLRRQVPLPVAFVLALGALQIVVTSGLPLLDDAGFGLAALALSASPQRAARAARVLALGGGAFAGVALLVKLNDGVAVTALVGIGLLGLPGARRTLPAAATTLVATVVVAWLAAGQPLDALPDYVSTGVAVVRGYVDAMGYDMLGPTGRWEVFVVIGSAILLSFGAWLSYAGAPRRQRLALPAAVLVVHYFVAREMFIRYEAGHAAAIALLVPVALLVPWRIPMRGFAWGSVALLTAAAVSVFGLEAVPPSVIFDPTARAAELVPTINAVASPQSTIAQGRAAIQAAEAIPAPIVQALDGHCVNAEPWEISAIWAYPAWRWCPIGVMQSYAAYTGSLDALDAAGYANARTGPDRVLRQNLAIDGRNPTWESPAAMLSLFCHFDEIMRGGQWQVLARIPDRCGQPKLVRSIRGDGPTPVPPAAPGTLLIARVYGLQIYKLERLRTLFGRASARALTVNGAVTYRVLPDTVSDGLVLDAPADGDYAPPFNFNLGVSSLEAEISGVPVPFTVRLYEVPVRTP